MAPARSCPSESQVRCVLSGSAFDMERVDARNQDHRCADDGDKSQASPVVLSISFSRAQMKSRRRSVTFGSFHPFEGAARLILMFFSCVNESNSSKHSS